MSTVDNERTGVHTMQPKDLVQLRVWLVSGATMADVESTSSYGLVGNERFTEQARRAYRMLWVWSARAIRSVMLHISIPDTREARISC